MAQHKATDGAGEPEPALRPGKLAMDGQGRAGRVMAVEAGALFLRPPGGGREGDGAADRAGPVPEDRDERLRTRLRELNAYSRWARSGDTRG